MHDLTEINQQRIAAQVDVGIHNITPKAALGYGVRHGSSLTIETIKFLKK
jgi:hypothetical protein